MYSEIYPALRSRLEINNFEAVIAVLDTQFRDLFDLPVLNYMAMQEDGAPVYWHRFAAVLQGVCNHTAIVKANPMLVKVMLEMAEAGQAAPQRLQSMFAVLAMIMEKDKTHSIVGLRHFAAGLSRFNVDAEGDEDLATMVSLIREGFGPEYVVFDNAAHYLRTRVPESYVGVVQDTMKIFYSLISGVACKAESLFQSEFFNFKSAIAGFAAGRVMWMHLLNHNAFVTHEKNAAGYAFSAEDNQHLFALGLRRYMDYAKEVLSGWSKFEIFKSRDLTVLQQTQLFGLAYELEAIGKARLAPDGNVLGENREQIQQLSRGCHSLMWNYRWSFFKSASRQARFHKLEKDLTGLLASDYISAKGKTRYHELYEYIVIAKKQALDDDVELYLKSEKRVHRSGHSRYLSTLNQLQDLVARHWLQDVDAVQEFQDYTDLNQREFDDMIVGLYDRFYKEYSRTDLVFCRVMLAYKNKAEKNRGDLDALLAEFKKIEPVVSGDLCAFTREVLVKGEALRVNMVACEGVVRKPLRV